MRNIKMATGIFICVILMGILSGCGLNGIKVQEGGSNIEDSGETVLHIAKLPKEYYITYEVESEDGVVETISKAVDAEGNVYYKAEDEFLFLLDGRNYVLYKRENGQFVKQEDKKYQSVYIEELTKNFDEYVTKENLTTSGISTYLKEDTVAGRKCDIYSITVRILSFEQKYQFAMDQETYACLKWDSEKNISGYEEAGEGRFTCIRFDTEQIDLKKELLSK